MPVLGAPEIRTDLSADYLGAAWVLLVLPVALGALIETPLLVWSDRWRRSRVVAAALAAQGLMVLLASYAATSWALGLALGVWGMAAGVSGGTATSALMEAYPDARERTLTRAALLASLGDAMAPGLIAVVYVLGGSWREALVVLAVVYAIQAAWVLFIPIDRARRGAGDPARPSFAPDEPEPEPLVVALRVGLARPGLVRWLGAAMLCVLLDEILVAFGSLYLREVLGATTADQAAAFTAFAVGGAVGLAVTERALARVPARVVLLVSATLCLGAYALWLWSASAALSVPLLALVGLGTGPLHPLAEARAYAAHPDRPGVVAALASLFTPLEVLAPLAIGAVANHWGLVPALALLALQPIGFLVFALSRAGAEPTSR